MTREHKHFVRCFAVCAMQTTQKYLIVRGEISLAFINCELERKIKTMLIFSLCLCFRYLQLAGRG